MTFAFDYGALEDEGSLPGEVVVVGGGGEYYEYYGGRLTELLDKGHSITLGSWEDDLAAGGGEGVVDEMLTLTLAGGDEGGAGGTLSSAGGTLSPAGGGIADEMLARGGGGVADEVLTPTGGGGGADESRAGGGLGTFRLTDELAVVPEA